MKSQKISVAIGVFAHNEENNIERALASILNSRTEVAVVKRIIVISSGSLDKTNRLVRRFASKDKRIQLIEQAERKGKSAAINLFLRQATEGVVLTMSADLKLHPEAIEEIASPFLNHEVGMVGGHPVPTNVRFSEVGEEVRLLWEFHHLVSLHKPKCGELVAFRNVIKAIPHDSAVDEATIEVLLRLLGYAVLYAPRAIVYNRGPRTLSEFIVQRRRVQAGHLWIGTKYNYTVSTMQAQSIVPVILAYLAQHPQNLWPLVRLLGVEVYAKFLGWLDFYVFGKNPYVWEMVKR